MLMPGRTQAVKSSARVLTPEHEHVDDEAVRRSKVAMIASF